eukprot:3221828-Rhodomonas_salina.1
MSLVPDYAMLSLLVCDVRYQPIVCYLRCSVLTSAMLLSGAGTQIHRQDHPMVKVSPAICLRACYAMPGTDIVYFQTGVRCCHSV